MGIAYADVSGSDPGKLQFVGRVGTRTRHTYRQRDGNMILPELYHARSLHKYDEALSSVMPSHDLILVKSVT